MHIYNTQIVLKLELGSILIFKQRTISRNNLIQVFSVYQLSVWGEESLHPLFQSLKFPSCKDLFVSGATALPYKIFK